DPWRVAVVELLSGASLATRECAHRRGVGRLVASSHTQHGIASSTDERVGEFAARRKASDTREELGREGPEVLQDRRREVLVAPDHEVPVLEKALRRIPAARDERETEPAALDQDVGFLVGARTLPGRERRMPAALADALQV